LPLVPITAAQLKTSIRNQIWPYGEPENLVSSHDLAFQEAFAEIAKWVPSEQVRNTDVIPFDETMFKCGQTVHPAPKGIVRRVYTLLPTVVGNPPGFCDPVDYQEVDYPKQEYFARKIMAYLTSLVPPTEIHGLGITPANHQTDSGCGRARYGIFAKNNGTLYVAPWLQSNELLVIEWDGIKLEWRDTDLVTNTQEYRKAVKTFVQYAHERDHGSEARAGVFHETRHVRGELPNGAFDEALAELMWQDRENTKRREMPAPSDLREVLTQDVINQGLPPDPTVMQTISTTGDIVDLTVTTTWLQAPATTPPVDILVQLPDGTFAKETKFLAVPGNIIPTTARFVVSGRFENPFSSLVFDALGTSANLIWDGFCWHLVGGNAMLGP
jgi:hypothetical protein